MHNRAAAQSASTTTNTAKFESEIELGRTERSKGHSAPAIMHFEAARHAAEANQNLSKQALVLSAIGAEQIQLFRYRDALTAVNSAHDLALAVGDYAIAGAAASNRATIYGQVGDALLARQNAQEAVVLLQRSGNRNYLAQALINLGEIESDGGLLQSAEEHLRLALRTANAAGLKGTESLAEEHLGFVLLNGRNYSGAEQALQRATSLRTELKDTDGLAVITRTRAKLAFQQGQFDRALELLNEAMRARSERVATIPQYWSDDLRGSIQLGLGHKSDALVSFAKAVDETNVWRRWALPGDLTSIQTSATIDSVYRQYMELAAGMALERHDSELAREAWTVLASSRAAGLRDQMIASLDRRMQLPPRYFELLQQLQSTEAALALGVNSKQSQSLAASLQRTRNELADLENKVGVGQPPSLASTSKDKTRKGNSIASIQRGLNPDEALLSFSLGKNKSFLWGISKTHFELYELAPEDVLNAHATAYFSAVQKGSGRSEGRRLSQELLGQLHPSLAAKKEWLIAADGALLRRVPFASLPVPRDTNPAGTLITAHTLRLLPSELMLLDRRRSWVARRFVGVGDPIYNRADTRLAHSVQKLAGNRISTAITLARLGASSAEVRSAAILSGTSDMQLLIGSDASGSRLREALGVPPSILHFAVHVINASGGATAGSDAALALSLTPDGVPELLTKEAIAGLRVPGALVVLSGCASQDGQVVPGAGLIGLGRAWLLAGAAAVIVSAWPVPDDSGEFFSDFYGHLKARDGSPKSLAQRASAALQWTQIDMQRSAGYRSSPSFWAAYSMISEE